MNIKIIEEATKLIKAEVLYQVELDVDDKHQLTFDMLEIVDITNPEEPIQNSIVEITNVVSETTDIDELKNIVSECKDYVEKHESEIIEMIRNR
ncbi:MAG TPA: hypothetical protein PKG96_07255 [Bacilli bacterium]|jgi:hypothetical protein|nr:hypothetical protein [Bacilli bacterium]HOH58532.1 hypothetical protein [Bacilli bacterium]HQM07250.1 hypothetical protein [Bacilli bacterium]